MAITKEDVKQKVVLVIKKHLSVEEKSIISAKSFEDLGADSLDMVEIIMSLEEKFNIEISDDDAEKFTSIDNAVDLIAGKVNS